MHKFNFKDPAQLQDSIEDLGLDIRYEEDLSPLHRSVKIGNKTANNSFAVLPMEGCDSQPDGAPSDLGLRRYRRFAEGGAGLIWGEANAVVEEGKANPLQLFLTDENLPAFADMTSKTKAAGLARNGYEPVFILQLTHSGRYSRPVGHAPAPLVPQHDPILDKRTGVVDDRSIVTDEYLDSLVPAYVHSAVLAKQAGFDGVDIKACHRYLVSELLASHTRSGKYGGSFENRSRFLLTVIEEVRKAVGEDFIIASRFNVFDAHPYPYGFGCDHDDMWKFDPTEPRQLVKAMIDRGVNLLSNSAGNPYYIYPQVTRPFDVSSLGIPEPEESQLVSIERLFGFSKMVQDIAGDIPVVGNGYSWLRQFLPNIGAANIQDGKITMVGLGRCAFAYPDTPRDVLLTGAMDPKKVCISCSKCTQLMRDHGKAGCVVRDNEIYGPLAKQYTRERIEREGA
jgi:2,4-dienoyl-CoA reductase-like NADH-dependent reductase (Old Yellow Enzyme family)